MFYLPTSVDEFKVWYTKSQIADEEYSSESESENENDNVREVDPAQLPAQQLEMIRRITNLHSYSADEVFEFVIALSFIVLVFLNLFLFQSISIQ